MRARLLLQVPPLGLLGEIIGEGPVDIDRVGVVALDQVRVIAVH